MTSEKPVGKSLCGIVLHPAGHTLSPVLHRAAYEQLRLDAEYFVFDIRPGALGKVLDAMRTLNIKQLSVSLPHKMDAATLADTSSHAVEEIGAANTLTLMPDGKIHADNTDWSGVLHALGKQKMNCESKATIIGAGGAARAAAYALYMMGCKPITIVNRTNFRAADLAREFNQLFQCEKFRAGRVEEEYDVLVNTTPIGMKGEHEGESPVPKECLRPGTTILDAVYNPLETRLYREARIQGCRAIDGLQWLAHQAAAQVHAWSGLLPDAALMRQAAVKVLRPYPINPLHPS